MPYCLHPNQVDVDGSGAVEWEEFCVLMYKKMREKDPENEIKEAFRQDKFCYFFFLPVWYELCAGSFDAEGTGFKGNVELGSWYFTFDAFDTWLRMGELIAFDI